VDTAGGLIRVTRLGYQPALLAVGNSPRDTEPLTITLARAGQTLATVVTHATRHATPRGPADTVRRLEDVGFYDRRTTTGAPSNAFVTAEKLDRMFTLDDLAKNLATASGRGICAENLYIDGGRDRSAGQHCGGGDVHDLGRAAGVQSDAGGRGGDWVRDVDLDEMRR
jgi:hypothetical protein